MNKIFLTLVCLFSITLSAFAKDRINVAFTIDNNYPIFTLIAIDSILKCNLQNNDYVFWIIENNLTDKNKTKMSKCVLTNNQKIRFINVDTNKIDYGKNYYFGTPITSIALARILIPDLLPDNIHKVLYLDSDILVVDDIYSLYNTDLSKYSVGMVLNNSQDNEALNLYQFKNGYYNSGVILMNLDKLREENFSKRALKFMKENENNFNFEHIMPLNKWIYADQDIINIVLDGKILKLPEKWNYQCRPKYKGDYGIIHYIADLKPWEFNKKNNKYLKMYHKYWLKSPFWPYYFYYKMKKYIHNFITNIL